MPFALDKGKLDFLAVAFCIFLINILEECF